MKTQKPKPTLVRLWALLIFSLSPSLLADPISLADATARALEKHPSLATFDAEKRAAEARILTALARPNPELEVEVEDILGSGEFRDLQSAIYTVGITQLLELGDKRQLRAAVAQAEVEIESLRYETVRREVILETARRFVGLLAAQSAEENARQIVTIAKETVDSVTGLQEGGRGSEIDVKRAELELKHANLQWENQQRQTAIASQQLAGMWGEAKPSFDRASGKLATPAENVPALDSMRDALESHPVVAMAEAGVISAENSLALERQLSTPDLGVGVGWRHDSIVEDNAVVLNFSLPLPIWNRNEGGIAEAEAEVDKNAVLVTQALTRLDLALSEAWTHLSAAHAEHQIVAGEMLPAAEELYASLSESFKLGRTSYLELLEARRSLTSVRRERIDALAKYHRARVEIEALTKTVEIN